MTDKVEGPGGSELIGSVRPLPTPDLTMPSVAPDGADGAHYYRASTVLALLSAERERWRDAINALADEWDDPAEAYGMRLALNEGLKA